MLPEFMVRAALASLGVAMVAGVLGCFVVWRRMAFFGDAVAHAAILGVAVSLGFSLSVFAGVFAIALIMALLLWGLEHRGLGQDAILAVLAYGALAIGLVVASLLPGQRINLETYLFGDVLFVSWTDVMVIWAGAAVLIGVMVTFWQPMLTSTLSPDLAHAAGISPRRMQLILTGCIAVMVALSIQVVGALLITALLIIPAAAARHFARTPEAMAIWAMGLGGLAAVGGLGMAVALDAPAGPSIVCVAAGLFAAARGIAGKPA